MVSGEWRGSRRVTLALHGRSFPTDEEWAEFIALVRRVFDEVGWSTEKVVGIAVTDGGAPTARHRLQLREMFAGHEAARAALLTTSRLARGIGIAVSLFLPRVRIFAPRDVGAAARHLGLRDDELDGLGDEIERLGAPLHLASVEELMSALRGRRRAS